MHFNLIKKIYKYLNTNAASSIININQTVPKSNDKSVSASTGETRVLTRKAFDVGSCSGIPESCSSLLLRSPVTPQPLSLSSPPNAATPLDKDSSELSTKISSSMEIPRNIDSWITLDLNQYIIPDVSPQHRQLSALSLAQPEFEYQNVEQISRLIPSMDAKSERKRRKSTSTSDIVNDIKITRKSSLSEKREFFNVRDQLTLIDLTRAHQCNQQGCLRKAPPRRNFPSSLGFSDDYAREHPGIYEAVQWYRLRFRSAKDTDGHRLGAMYPIIVASKASISIRKPSRLSLSYEPDEIGDINNSAIKIKKTFRKNLCDESEAYLTWLLKQCEQMNDRILNNSITNKPTYSANSGNNLELIKIHKSENETSWVGLNGETEGNQNMLSCFMPETAHDKTSGPKISNAGSIEIYERNRYAYIRSDGTGSRSSLDLTVTDVEEIEVTHVDDVSTNEPAHSRNLLPTTVDSPFNINEMDQECQLNSSRKLKKCCGHNALERYEDDYRLFYSSQGNSSETINNMGTAIDKVGPNSNIMDQIELKDYYWLQCSHANKVRNLTDPQN